MVLRENFNVEEVETDNTTEDVNEFEEEIKQF